MNKKLFEIQSCSGIADKIIGTNTTNLGTVLRVSKACLLVEET